MNILSYHNCLIEGDNALLTFSVPVEMVDAFKTFMVSAGALSHFTAVKTKHQLAIKRVQDQEISVLEKRQYEKVVENILKRFDFFISHGCSFRQAFRQIRDESQARGGSLTCYQVELICREAGRLSKRKK